MKIKVTAIVDGGSLASSLWNKEREELEFKLIPGASYSFDFIGRRDKNNLLIKGETTIMIEDVQPGQCIDLGDIVIPGEEK